MKDVVNWLSRRPTTVLSLLFLLMIATLFVYQLVRPLDVLEDWRIELTPAKEYKVVDGRRLAVFHPNESLIFTSTSEKVSHANGNTSRTLVCEATTDQEEREILLDVIPAVKEPGFAPERASSIILPDVVQFNRLPRICRLVIDITYTNVSLWRNHSEHAETEPFIVEELQLTPQQMRDEIEKLKLLILELEKRLENQPLTATPPNNSEIPTPQTESQPGATPKPEVKPQEQPRGIVPSLIDGVTDTVDRILGR